MKLSLSATLLLALACVVLSLSGCASRKASPAERAPATPGAQRIAATERPGIGTHWGPARVSWVEPTTFPRANGNRPAVRGFVYYNDRDGINAMLDYLGGEARKAHGLQPLGDLTYGLRDGDGRWLTAWELKGQRFVVGESGQRYEVVLKNESTKRVEIIVSIDGLDALDGEPTRYEKRGYVLDPREEMAVEGFRTSDGTVAAFTFGRMGETYAQRRHGDTRNCGVIGVSVFREGRDAGNVKDQPQPRRRARPGEAPSSRDYAKPPTDA